MFKFSKRSERNLESVHPYLAMAVRKALSYGDTDFSVVEGVRSVERQRELYSKGATRTMNSLHLEQPDGYGHAVDLYPWPIDMEAVRRNSAVEIVRFGVIKGLVFAAFKELETDGLVSGKLRWGGDWDMDGQTLDHSFFDAPHIEIRL